MMNSISAGQLLVALFTALLAIFSYYQHKSMKEQQKILEREYKPDLELYLTEKERESIPVLCLHNNGGSSAVGVEIEAMNKSDGDTYNVEGDPIEIPVIEPMQTAKIDLPKNSGARKIMEEDPESLYQHIEEVQHGSLEKKDLDIVVQLTYRDSRDKTESINKEFNLIDDRFIGEGIEFPTEDKERYIVGLDMLESAVSVVGTEVAELKREIKRR